MNTAHGRASLMLTAGLLVGCTERITSTPATETPSVAFDAGAAPSTCVVNDPIGDVKNKAPTWLDLTAAAVTSKDRHFIFEWDVASTLPANPELDPAVPMHSDHICVGSGLDTDPTSAPAGYPFGKNETNFAEFYVAMCWNPTGSFGFGSGFVGLLIDRRPLTTGQAAAIFALETRIVGSQVVVVVDDAALGDPSTFSWVAFTEVANQADPNDAAWFPDVAPDASLASWPQ